MYCSVELFVNGASFTLSSLLFPRWFLICVRARSITEYFRSKKHFPLRVPHKIVQTETEEILRIWVPNANDQLGTVRAWVD